MLPARLGKADGRQDMQNTFRLAIAAASAAIASQASAGDIGTHYRYDFEITVTENDFAGNLGALGVGTVGRLTYLVDTDTNAFDFSDDVIRFYRLYDIEFDVGGIQAAGNVASYPSPTFLEAFIVANDIPAATGNQPPHTYTDSIQSILFWDDAEFGFSSMNIIEERPASEPLPELTTSLDLPLSIDLSRTTTNGFFIRSAINSSTDIRFEFTDVEITVVPTPGTGALLALTGLAAMRRRR